MEFKIATQKINFQLSSVSLFIRKNQSFLTSKCEITSYRAKIDNVNNETECCTHDTAARADAEVFEIQTELMVHAQQQPNTNAKARL